MLGKKTSQVAKLYDDIFFTWRIESCWDRADSVQENAD